MDIVEENIHTQNFLGALKAQSKVLENPLSVEALNLVLETDFPNRRSELWKYSRTGKIKNGNFQFSNATAKNDFESYSTKQINIVNGIVEQTTIEGVEIETLAQISAERLNHLGTVVNFNRDVFTLAHQAYFQDCLFVHVPSGTSFSEPIQINIAANGENCLSLPRIFICADESSSSQFIFNISGGNAKQFQHLVAEVFVQHHAKVEVSLLQNTQTEFTLTDIAANVETSANFHTNTLAFKGDWIRNNLDICISGEHSHAELNGIVMPAGNQHIDNHTMVHHCVPHCTSSENYKNIVNDNGTAIFNGKIMVHPDAQKTNAFQSSANVLLSPNATVNAKPELEIYADDVKCSHGSTTGKMNAESLFYLRSRGIPELEARKLLLKAFSAEVIDEISNENVLAFANQQIDQKLV